jgi:general stress protein 26
MQTYEDIKHVWDVIEHIPNCMLVTRHRDHMHSRPMHAFVRQTENAIYFLTDVRTHKEEQLEEDNAVCLTFVDGAKFVSISGAAQISSDHMKIKELWTPAARAWWESDHDPNIRVLKVNPFEAELWEAPGKLLKAIAMASIDFAGAPGDIDLTRPEKGNVTKVKLGSKDALKFDGLTNS